MTRIRQLAAPVLAPGPLALVGLRAEVAAQLQSRIDRGNELQARPIESRDDADLYKSDLRKWREYNFELLRQIFTNETIAREYTRAGLVSRVGDNEGDDFEILRETTNRDITKLESIVERLELYPEQGGVQVVAADPDLSKVFIVHGHARASKAEVDGFIRKLGFEPIILHERPNKGRALITKFREEAAGAGFAVVLMTPDDLGKAETAADLKPRARQNVVFELGFFIGKLGPEHVAALVEGDIEIPSDFDGVVYIPLDEADWQTKLGIELKEAGYKFDWNKVLRR